MQLRIQGLAWQFNVLNLYNHNTLCYTPIQTVCMSSKFILKCFNIKILLYVLQNVLPTVRRVTTAAPTNVITAALDTRSTTLPPPPLMSGVIVSTIESVWFKLQQILYDSTYLLFNHLITVLCCFIAHIVL